VPNVEIPGVGGIDRSHYSGKGDFADLKGEMHVIAHETIRVQTKLEPCDGFLEER
jgi:hypothetical protein